MNVLLALATGHLLVFLFPRFDAQLLAPVALAPLLYACAREPAWWRRLLLGELSGAIFWGGTCYWIRPTLAEYGGLNAPLAWLAFLLFALAKGAHLAVFAWLAGYIIHSPWHRPWAIPALAALWVGIERTHGTLGFAWLALGDAGITMSVPMRLAPLAGVYGLSFVFAMLNAAVVLAVLRRPRRDLLPLLALPLLLLLPELPEREPGRLTALTIQPNVAMEASEDEAAIRGRMALRSLEGALAAPPPSLILWPEVPAGLYYDADPALREEVGRLAVVARVPLLFGAVTHTRENAPMNSAVLIDTSGAERARYSKINLVPFGEFVPPLFEWVGKVSDEAGNFAPGTQRTVMDFGRARAGVFICYESAFPDFVRQYARDGASVLVNLSNDGYFFRTSARAQHLAVVRMRAAENRRWILRSTNDGTTASIDPAGRVMHTLPPFRETSGRLPFNAVNDVTPYSRHGDWFAWTCLAAGLASAVAGALRR